MTPTQASDIHGWLFQLGRLTAVNTCTAPNFIRPFHLVTLALQAYRGRTTQIDIPAQLRGYASRMRLWQAIGLPPPVVVTEHPERGRFMPAERLDDRDKIEDSASRLAAIARKFGPPDNTVNSLEISLQEILYNCFAHSEMPSELQGLACTQSWPKGDRAQIAIADLGVGIRHSLSGNPLLLDRLAHENCCELATEYGVTSKPGRGHGGYGLAVTRRLMENSGGTLIVMSQNEWFESRAGKIARGTAPVGWSGTLVVIEWALSSPLEVKDVYSSLPLPEGMTDDDFDF